jgi:hypothetical protein
MFEPDTPDEPGWSDNVSQPDDRDEPPAPSDDSDGGLFRLELSTALYWGGVFSVTATIMLLFLRWIAWHVSGDICIGETYNDGCWLANVAINDIVFLIMTVYAVIATLWTVRARPRDANPWIVMFMGCLGVIAGIFAARAVAAPLAGALQINHSALAYTVVGIVAAVVVALSTVLQPKLRQERWRRIVFVALPFVLFGLIGVNVRTDLEVRGNFVEAVSYRVSHHASTAERAANRFPERQKALLAGEWLDQPHSIFREAQLAVFEDHIGKIDAVGHGQDFRLVVEHVLERATSEERPADEVAVEMAGEGLLQNIHVIGRRGSAYCLTEISTSVDKDRPFEFFGETPTPRVATHLRPHYCVVDDQLFTFDDSLEPPRHVGTLRCSPLEPPHPYATSTTERDRVRRLQKGDTTSDVDEQACPRPGAPDTIRIHREGPPTFTPAVAGLDDKTDWAGEVADELGLAPRQPDATSYEELSPDQRVDYLREAIRRAQRGPAVPRHNALEPLFGRVVDGFSTARLNRIVDKILRRIDRLHDEDALAKLASGIDIAHFVVGETYSGWCVYRLKVKAAPDDGGVIRADLDHRLRYCLAGTQLHAFDSVGEVTRSWNATGLPRRAPLFDPSDTSQFVGEDREAFEKMVDRFARDGLIKRFLDGLVSGELDDVSQLETIELARGADLLEPSTKEAMRRMLE